MGEEEEALADTATGERERTLTFQRESSASLSDTKAPVERHSSFWNLRLLSRNIMRLSSEVLFSVTGHKHAKRFSLPRKKMTFSLFKRLTTGAPVLSHHWGKCTRSYAPRVINRFCSMLHSLADGWVCVCVCFNNASAICPEQGGVLQHSKLQSSPHNSIKLFFCSRTKLTSLTAK